jgi:hypothetical protein
MSMRRRGRRRACDIAGRLDRRTDFARSTAFYDKAFAPLGVRRQFDVPSEFTDGAPSTG